MSAPNRKAAVKAICQRYPQAFGEPAKTQDARRRLLIPIIARELNHIDGGNWGVLYRNDRQDDDPIPGRLTADVIVWKPTLEHFDVLSANGGMWEGHGPITDTDWEWRDPRTFPSWDAAAEPKPETPDPPAPPVTDPVTALTRRVEKAEAFARERFEALNNSYNTLTDRIDTLQARLAQLADQSLTDLVVDGSTGRTLGHAHPLRIPVKKG